MNAITTQKQPVAATCSCCAKLLLCLKIALNETEDGIAICYQILKSYNRYDRAPEILLFIILQILDAYDEKEAWIHTYEKALANNIQPRMTLREHCAKLKAERH